MQADGLLEGIFSDPVAAGQLLFTPGALWDAATKDAAAAGMPPAAYLARVEGAMVAFFEEAEEDGIPRVVNHEPTMAALRSLGVGASKGLLTLLTGPLSIGKTLMLRKVAAEIGRGALPLRRMVLFDARQYGADLTGGIISYLTAAQNNKLLQFVLDAAPAPVAAVLALAAKYVAPHLDANIMATGVTGLVGGAPKHSRDRLSAEVPLDELLGALFVACKKAGEAPIIVIDEANHALDTTDPDLKRRTKDLLQLFTRVTKQHREATVVLATSEHGLPFRLRQVGFAKGHIGKVIVAEEVPPAVMKDLLVGTWGCGEHLATALLNLYGGHVLHASAAVRELRLARDPATMPGSAAITTIVGDPADCLSDEMLDEAGVPDAMRADVSKRLREALRTLVVDGYVPLASDKDQVAEVISLANVGMLVPNGATAWGVPPRAWAARTASGGTPVAVLLPSSHTMQLLIANAVFPPPL